MNPPRHIHILLCDPLTSESSTSKQWTILSHFPSSWIVYMHKQKIWNQPLKVKIFFLIALKNMKWYLYARPNDKRNSTLCRRIFFPLCVHVVWLSEMQIVQVLQPSYCPLQFTRWEPMRLTTSMSCNMYMCVPLTGDFHSIYFIIVNPNAPIILYY